MRVRTRLLVSALIVIVLVAGVLAAPTLIERRYNRIRNRPPYQVPTATRELHQRLFVADLHADSLLWGRDLLHRSTTGHVDIPRLQEANVSLQVFSVVTTIPSNLNIERNAGTSDRVRYLSIVERWPPRTWNSPKERALYQAAELRKFEAQARGNLVFLRTRSDLQTFVVGKGQRIAVLLAAEGAQPLEGKLDNLDVLYAAGFRMMSPTHFTDTEIGGSASGLGRAGLSDLGHRWVRSMEARDMVIDLAHASSATLHDVTAIATKPVIVSYRREGHMQ